MAQTSARECFEREHHALLRFVALLFGSRKDTHITSYCAIHESFYSGDLCPYLKEVSKFITVISSNCDLFGSSTERINGRGIICIC